MSLIETQSSLARQKLGCSEAEWRTRLDLAACYRLAEMNGMGKVIWNHITARVPGEPDNILVFRLGCRYDEVTASNLVKMTLDGRLLSEAAGDLNTPAAVIHSGIYLARADVGCVMHTHSRGARGVSALKEGLMPLTQEALQFYEDVAYHEYEGISDDRDECERLARDLGAMNQMIMRNHGVITVVKSVGEAYWRMYQLEMACAAQMDILATGREYTLPSPELCRKVRQQFDAGFYPGHHEWPPLLRYCDKVAPDYAT